MFATIHNTCFPNFCIYSTTSLNVQHETFIMLHLYNNITKIQECNKGNSAINNLTIELLIIKRSNTTFERNDQKLLFLVAASVKYFSFVILWEILQKEDFVSLNRKNWDKSGEQDIFWSICQGKPHLTIFKTDYKETTWIHQNVHE